MQDRLLGARGHALWGIEALVTVRAHMDGRVPGRVLFHDAIEPVGRCVLTVVCDGAWFVAGVLS